MTTVDCFYQTARPVRGELAQALAFDGGAVGAGASVPERTRLGVDSSAGDFQKQWVAPMNRLPERSQFAARRVGPVNRFPERTRFTKGG